MPELTGKKILFIIAPVDWRDEELSRPREILEKAGASITIATSTGQPSKSMFGKIVDTVSFHSIKSSDYNAVVFVGGTGATRYFHSARAHEIAKEFFTAVKPVAAICVAPTILVNAHIMHGKRATAWPSERDNINAVGLYTGNDIEIDGNIITASGPKAAEAFGKAILEALKKR